MKTHPWWTLGALFKHGMGLLGLFLAILPLPASADFTPNADFTINTDGTVIHRLTGLMWMRCVLGQSWTGTTCNGIARSQPFEAAVTQAANSANFAGRSDWRMPSTWELASIVDYDLSNPAINGSLFPGTLGVPFWSYNAGGVNFSNGQVLNMLPAGSVAAVRLVRGQQSLSMPGSDFTDNGDGTVTHKRTGFTWMRCSLGQTWTGTTCTNVATTFSFTQATALTSVQKTFAAKSDWRVPDVQELVSIVDYESNNPAINKTIFPNSPSSAAWTSTPVGADSAWRVDFGLGGSSTAARSSPGSVRLVRGAQSSATKVPGSPTGVTAVASNGIAIVSFNPPANVGGGIVTSYTVIASPGPRMASDIGSPIIVGGLNAGTSYTFTVIANNGFGAGTSSSASNAVVPLTPQKVLVALIANCQDWVNAGSSITCSASASYFNTPAQSAVVTPTWSVSGSGATIDASGTLTASASLSADSNVTVSASYTEGGVTKTATQTVTIASGTITSTAPPDGLIAAREMNSFAIDSSGRLLAWGDDGNGQLGQGRTLQSSIPLRVGTGFKTSGAGVVATGGSSFAIKSDGTLWAWGNNSAGQFGDGSNTNRTSPVQVGNGYASLVSGNGHTVALKSDGTLWAWGSNAIGAVGDGGKGIALSAVQIGTGRTYSAIAAGANHTLALATDGSLYAWGDNSYGQLGFATTETCGSMSCSSTPQLVGTGYSAIAAGERTSFGLKSKSLYAWGANDSLQLGISSTEKCLANKQVISCSTTPASVGSDYSAVVAGNNHTAALKSDGTLVTWGQNMLGQIGEGTSQPNSRTTQFSLGTGYSAIAAGTNHTLALKRDGTLWAWGSNWKGQLGFTSTATCGNTACTTSPKQVDSTVALIAASGNNSMVVRTDGSAWAWGDNTNGQLGDGSVVSRSTPTLGASGFTSIVPAGGTTFGIKGDRTLWAWGTNGGRFADGTNTDTPTPIQIGAGFKSVSAGIGTFGIKTDGSLWAWGNNWNGQLGDGTTIFRASPLQIGSGFSKVISGWSHTVALKSDGTVWAWGDNTRGQIGDGTTAYRATPVQVGSGFSDIAVGAEMTINTGFTLALKPDGSLWAWGSNSFGQLGDGTRATSYQAKQVGSGYKAVAAGVGHSVALKNDGTLWAWGFNGYGQLGDSTMQLRAQQTQIGTGFSAVAAGGGFTLALKTDGSVWAWGANFRGQLGNGSVAGAAKPMRVLNDTATGFMSLTGKTIDNSADPFKVLQVVGRSNADLSTKVTDLRATGFDGQVYFTALLPQDSPLISATKRGHRDGSTGMVPVTISRGGYKQTGPSTTATVNYTGAVSSNSEFTVYEKSASDPLSNSNAVICMGLTSPALSAKGQVIMSVIATGDNVSGAVQCATVQTEATTRIYTAQTSGPLTARTITATINPLVEDRGQVRSIYSWAVAPDGSQLMQTAQGWDYMAEPMQAVETITVPADGSSISLPITVGLDLTSLVGTLVYVGMGTSWEEVRSLNMAGHYYTIQ